jgi:hypothetical protein
MSAGRNFDKKIGKDPGCWRNEAFELGLSPALDERCRRGLFSSPWFII